MRFGRGQPLWEANTLSLLSQLNTNPPSTSPDRALGADLSGAALAAVHDIVDRVVSEALDDALATTTASLPTPPSSSATTTATATEAGHVAPKGSFGYLHGTWCWEWLVLGAASGHVGVGVCTAKASLTVRLRCVARV